MAEKPRRRDGMPESPPADMPARGGNLSAVRGEEAFAETMRVKGADGLVVVKFGASWCTHCAEMLSEFGEASRRHPDAHFVLADVDTLPETAEHIRFTPTFAFYRKGRKVDEISKVKPATFATACGCTRPIPRTSSRDDRAHLARTMRSIVASIRRATRYTFHHELW